MSADFWAGYISGAAGIILGNPLDVLKVRLQAGVTTPSPSPTPSLTSPVSSPARPNPAAATPFSYARPFLLGTAAPVLGYGALNALLFVSYNRTEAFLNQLSGGPGSGSDSDPTQGRGTNLLTTWLAGAVGGLATWVVSTPTELVKCRAQLAPAPTMTIPTTTTTTTITNPGGIGVAGGGSTGVSSWSITKQTFLTQGLRGLYAGGAVTVLRDSIGYGFYFAGYELCSRLWIATIPNNSSPTEGGGGSEAAARVLLCGGLAGVISWASIFPLDVIKTRVQTQQNLYHMTGTGERAALLGGGGDGNGARKLGAWEVARETYRAGGARPFFRGLAVCSVRAFIVNAVQWAVYEWVMMELGQGRRVRGEVGEMGVVSG
ncbi:mitochondrial carrier domain-containing protein [Parachaetomium inaequale]|uniref:Mitochondrial carrier domain-containing protein n=1 Tax=Parachaetomium inaequale TaxID=2588326 RepID=A0AAN6SMZ1_9PEZI|nr:mitochondrial carrier domain-containing protein [Parachaetomium inaequale]